MFLAFWILIAFIARAFRQPAMGGAIFFANGHPSLPAIAQNSANGLLASLAVALRRWKSFRVTSLVRITGQQSNYQMLLTKCNLPNATCIQKSFWFTSELQCEIVCLWFFVDGLNKDWKWKCKLLIQGSTINYCQCSGTYRWVFTGILLQEWCVAKVMLTETFPSTIVEDLN